LISKGTVITQFWVKFIILAQVKNLRAAAGVAFSARQRALGWALEPAIERSEAMTAKMDRFECGKELLRPQSGFLKQILIITWFEFNLQRLQMLLFAMNCLA